MKIEDKVAFKNTFGYKIIYAFTVDDDIHRGLIKIGEATLNTTTSIDKLSPNCNELNMAAKKRIKSYTNTVGITPNLLYTELAVKQSHDKLKAFRDHDVHRVLENSGIKKVQIGDSTGREWYKVDKDTVIEAISAVKKNYFNLSNTKITEYIPIIFRPEQKDAIELTIKQFKKNDKMLWNAKMRFGKTLSALEVVKRCKFKKLLY